MALKTKYNCLSDRGPFLWNRYENSWMCPISTIWLLWGGGGRGGGKTFNNIFYIAIYYFSAGTIYDTETLLEFAKLGSYCEYDLFGIETSHYQLWQAVDMPSDAQRIAFIRTLLDSGYSHKVLVAHDIHTKHRLVSSITIRWHTNYG